MTQEHQKLDRILRARMKFMRRDWTDHDVEEKKTFVRITFSLKREIDGKIYPESRKIEYELTPKFTMEDVIEDQQRKLGRDIIEFVGKDLMNEILEVLVG